MANLEIAKIQNGALKAAAIEVDEQGKKDGYIDSSEITLFANKAADLLEEKKCTAQEFTALFATNEVDRTNETDMFVKVYSIHNAKNSLETLAKDAEEAKQAEKHAKIKELKTKIADNDKKLELYKKLSRKEYGSDDGISSLKKACENLGMSFFTGSMAAMLGGYLSIFVTKSLVASTLAIGGSVVALGSLVLGIGMKCYIKHKEKDKSNSKELEEMYKEAYIKTSLENEQLKAQLAELQKK